MRRKLLPDVLCQRTLAIGLVVWPVATTGSFCLGVRQVPNVTSAKPFGRTIVVTPVCNVEPSPIAEVYAAARISFFATTKKGYVYKFACPIRPIEAQQVFVTNPAIAKDAASDWEKATPIETSAVRLVQAMAGYAQVPGFTVRQSSSLTCDQPGGRVAVSEVKGFISFAGKSGVRGRVVSREGNLVTQALLAGIIGGFGRGFSANANTVFSNQQTTPNGTIAKLSAGDILGGGLGHVRRPLSERTLARSSLRSLGRSRDRCVDRGSRDAIAIAELETQPVSALGGLRLSADARKPRRSKPCLIRLIFHSLGGNQSHEQPYCMRRTCLSLNCLPARMS